MVISQILRLNGGAVIFAYPYLWKTNKVDTDYKASFSAPRLPKEKKEEVKKQIVIPKMEKDRSMKR